MIIYKITNLINNKIYIGLTTTELKVRWNRHCVKSDPRHLYCSMRKYGIENFTIEQIDSADSIIKLGELERYYIEKYNSQDPNIGYNLSAGGPVVNPKANVILITPICPHSLQSNSLVLSPEDEIDIYIENVRESQLEEAYVTFDGQVARKLQPGDVLQVRKSKKIARIIKVKGDSFYRILRIKVGGQNEEK